MGLHQLRLREPLGLCQHRLTLKVEVLDHEREFRSFRFGSLLISSVCTVRIPTCRPTGCNIWIHDVLRPVRVA
jgi:hypothetical protein